MKSMDQTRSELLDALAQLSRLRPQWRLGQTLANLATAAGRLDLGGVWDLEDDEALAAAKALIEEHSDGNPVDAQAAAAPGRNSMAASRNRT